MNDRSLVGRMVLVTGGAKGIGRACCLRLAQAGAHVALNYLSSEESARETANLVRQAGVRSHPLRADATSPEQVAAMVQETTGALGLIDLLVNNAGVFHFLSHHETMLDVWRKKMTST